MKAAPYLTRRRFLVVNALLGAGLAVTICAAALTGPVHIDVGRALQWSDTSNPDFVILFDTRLPRVLLGAVVGGALAVAGAALQGLLRNPLAEPHILGISGGAALGGIVAIILAGQQPLAALSAGPLGSFLGALIATLLIYRLALVRGRLQPYTLLLTGVVVSAFTGALIMFVNSLADFYQAHGILFWLMGSLATQSYRLVGVIALYAVAAAVWLTLQARHMNVLALGEEAALQLGVDVERTRRVVFLASSLLVGAVVSVSGMIGFVGLIVPHLLRLALGADHRLLLPASFIAGGIFLVWADTLARTVLGSTEIPVGVVTALCGAPFFIYLLKRTGRKALD
jgi:iron complex transport system permease protein